MILQTGLGLGWISSDAVSALRRPSAALSSSCTAPLAERWLDSGGVSAAGRPDGRLTWHNPATAALLVHFRPHSAPEVVPGEPCLLAFTPLCDSSL